jgi:hypothetical protein
MWLGTRPQKRPANAARHHTSFSAIETRFISDFSISLKGAIVLAARAGVRGIE